MRPDDDAAPPDPVEPGVDDSAPTAPDDDPIAQAVGVEIEAEAEADPDAVAFNDEDLLEADLGGLDAPLPHDELDDLDEQLLDSVEDDDDDDDDYELALLHELGIDLDAPDAEEVGVDLVAGLDDDSGDEEVAA